MCHNTLMNNTNKEVTMKHKSDCKMSFGRKDPTCDRCQELLNGAAPRSGWQAGYFSFKKQQEANQLAAIKNHKCTNCGPVCTFGDW